MDKNDILAIFGGIWRTPDVIDQPEVKLVRWRVLEILEGPRQGERHLVGYNAADWEGRVSGTIVSVDAETKRCTTRSGRVYELVGPPGFDPDGDYVWRVWLRAYRVSGECDVSSEFEASS